MMTTKLKWSLISGIALILMYIYANRQFPLNQVIAETMLKQKHAPFNCAITASKQQTLDAGIWVNFTIYNTSNKDLELLSWYTPFEGFMSELFTIQKQDNKTLIYQGPKVKRLLPQPADFISIPANGTLDTELDLTLVYPLTKGEYSITLLPRRLQYKIRDKDAPLQAFHCKAQDITVHII